MYLNCTVEIPVMKGVTQFESGGVTYVRFTPERTYNKEKNTTLQDIVLLAS